MFLPAHCLSLWIGDVSRTVLAPALSIGMTGAAAFVSLALDASGASDGVFSESAKLLAKRFG